MTGNGRRLWRWILWPLAVLALLTLPACSGEEPAAVMEGVLVYQHGSAYYLYTEDGSDKIYTVPDSTPGSMGELAVGQRVRVNFDGAVLEIAPPRFSKVYSIDILGTAGDGEFQKGLDYFNTEIKPWHIDGAIG